MTEPEFDKELRLEKEDAAGFLRELADTVEDDQKIMLEGKDWKVYQPYEDTVPIRLTQDDYGLEVDIKLLRPEEE